MTKLSPQNFRIVWFWTEVSSLARCTEEEEIEPDIDGEGTRDRPAIIY